MEAGCCGERSIQPADGETVGGKSKCQRSGIMPKGSKMECNDYRGILLLNLTHNMFTQLVATYLETYVDEILGDYHCGFRRS